MGHQYFSGQPGNMHSPGMPISLHMPSAMNNTVGMPKTLLTMESAGSGPGVRAKTRIPPHEMSEALKTSINKNN